MKVIRAYIGRRKGKDGVITDIDFVFDNKCRVTASIDLDIQYVDRPSFVVAPGKEDLEVMLERTLKERINTIDGKEVSSYDYYLERSLQRDDSEPAKQVHYEDDTV
jgi:hypothetical protein